jgi:Beta propeller domain
MRPRTNPIQLWVTLTTATFGLFLATAAGAGESTLQPFGSDAELKQVLQDVQAQADAAAAAAAASEPTCNGCLESVESIVTTGARAEPSITNSQHAEVDEGGIVKQHGDHLVILRRGRLFTVDVSGPRLHPVSSINAYAPGADPSGTWYDEMLVSDNKVVVIGYSYERGGTEVGVFTINDNGGLRYQATYHFRSFDYYSSRNYASRLIGSKLILYAPVSLVSHTDEPLDVLPAMRKWHAGDDAKDEDPVFKPIATARRIYRSPFSKPTPDSILHSVTVCNLARVELECQATGVMGDWGRVFYVSPKAMYVWATNEASSANAEGTSSTLYRLPLDGSEPGAIGVSGEPVDQFSFDETRDGYLNVLVRSESGGDAMWNAERSAGAVALLRLATRLFVRGPQVAPASAYRELPRPQAGPQGAFHNRFVGKFLLYGVGEGWFDEKVHDTRVFVVHVASGRVKELTLPHGVDRIEEMGSSALVVGTSGDDLHFSGVRLSSSDAPSLLQHHVLANASQGELRSQGFFYKPDGRGGGVLGLPVRNPAAPGYEHLFEESAGIVFLRNHAAKFQELGQLRAHDESAQDDSCAASCVDWYGNSRPVFIDDRIFALLGYEIVEGTLRRGEIRELRRASFAPRLQTTRLD